MSFRLTFFTSGAVLIILAVSMLFPAMLDYKDSDGNLYSFLISSVVTFFVGGLLFVSNKGEFRKFNIREGFLLTSISWLLLSLFGAIPFYLSNLEPSFVDAFFESLSGVSTTGATVFSGLDDMSRGILLWRSILQWIGGIGVVAFAMVVLPFLKIGGMQLFQTESSDRSEKIIPNSRKLISQLLLIYIILTLACLISYYFLGMSFFDALNHALTTISTGGYSTHDQSFGFFHSISLDTVATIFMLLGGMPLVLYVRAVFLKKFSFLQDEQVKGFLIIIFAITALLTLLLILEHHFNSTKNIVLIMFHVVSIITTTGYAIDDYILWGGAVPALFFFITYLGGCAGSTSGGLKVMRLLIVIQSMKRQIIRLLSPHTVFTPRYQGKVLDKNLRIAVFSFLFLYVVFNVIMTLMLTFVGIDFTTAISGAATAIANVGPGIGNIIGPSGNFASLPSSAKWILCVGMFVGRLEILTVLIIFTPQFWSYNIKAN